MKGGLVGPERGAFSRRAGRHALLTAVVMPLRLLDRRGDGYFHELARHCEAKFQMPLVSPPSTSRVTP